MFHSEFHVVGSHRLHLALGPENGPPLVLFHGVTRAWNDWTPLIDTLASRWQIVGVDFRGHGQSDRTPGAYAVVDYVRDAVQLVSDIADEPAVVVGHSLGAMVALAVAAELPDVVQGAVAEDPPFHTMGDRIAATPLLEYFHALNDLCRRGDGIPELTGGLADLPVRSPDGKSVQRLGDLRDAASLRFAAACLQQVDRDVLEPIVAGRWLDGYEVEAVLTRLQAPTLLLQADATVGGMLTDNDAALAQRTARECYVERFPGVGHLIHWTDTAGMMRRTLAFLESLRVGEVGESEIRPQCRATTRDGGGATLHARDTLDDDGGTEAKSHRIDGHETRPRHDSHQKRPVG